MTGPNTHHAGAAVLAATALLLSACTPGQSGEGAPVAASGPDYTSITGWTDTCEVFDVDAVTGQLHIAAYTDGPVSLGPWEGDYPGAVKCISFFDFPAYELPEGYSDQDLYGWMYQVLVPYGDVEEAAAAYQEMYDSAAAAFRDRPEREQVVDEVITGPWDEGAILASVGPGGAFRTFYRQESYVVLIEIGYLPDPGVQQGLALTTMDTFEAPTYEFTPPELADWFTADYLPGLDQAITARLER